MRRVLGLALVGATVLVLPACGLILGLPSADDVKLVGDAAPTDASATEGGDAITGPDAPPLGDGAVGLPEPLLSDATKYFPTALALDGAGKLYFIDTKNYSIVQIDLSSQNLNTTVVVPANPALDYLSDLAVDTSFVYFTNYKSPTIDGGVYRCPVSGCMGAPTRIEGTRYTPRDIELDGTTLYVSFYGEDAIGKTTNATAATPTWATLVPTSGPKQMAQQGNDLFWTDYTDVLRKCPTGGCASPPEFAPAPAENPSLDAMNVFWSERSQNDATTIWSMPRGGGTKTKLVENQQWVYALIADPVGSYVYYATRLDSKVQRCAKTAGAAPAVLATDIDAYAFAIDATYVYYSGGGNVFRVRK